jgi:hypothetical protein
MAESSNGALSGLLIELVISSEWAWEILTWRSCPLGHLMPDAVLQHS